MLHLQPAAQRPFADWFADVERRVERRTGERHLANTITSDYWLALYHCGESAWNAADEFVCDYRARR